MKPSLARQTIQYFIAAVCGCVITSQTSLLPAYGQGKADSAGATTISSKQKVDIIIDRERTPQQTFLLLKIIVPAESKVETFTLTNPNRLVVDFIGVKIKTTEVLQPPKNGIVSQIRLGAHPEKLRIVMDLIPTTLPQYEWRAGPRQVTLKILESGEPVPASPSAPPAQAPPTQVPVAPTLPPTLVPTLVPTLPPTQTQPPTPAPTLVPTIAPTSTPTIAPTSTPTATRTPTPTGTPSPRPATSTPTPTPTPPKTKTPTPEPTASPTRAPTQQPVVQNTPAPSPERVAGRGDIQPKLPNMSDKELEAILDQEVARAAAALERGEELEDPVDAAGEDLVEVAQDDTEATDDLLSDDTQPTTDDETQDNESKKSADRAAIVAKDLPTGTVNQPTAPKAALGSLRANSVPAQPTTDFVIESAEFDFLEPDHHQAFRFRLNRPGAQPKMSKVDTATYRIVIPKCGLANLGLALPQYPPSDFKGLAAISSKTEGDTVEVDIQVEEGTSLTTLTRDREIWVKKQ